MSERNNQNTKTAAIWNEEIHKLVQNANLKLKATILLMASSGVRIGAVPSLLKGHLERRGDLYKISYTRVKRVKANTILFCTPECGKSD